MPYDEQLADRIRDYVAALDGITEKKMFGGVCFLLHGNMAFGPVRDTLIVRVPREEMDAILAEPDAAPMTFTGKPMRGFVQVDVDALSEDEALAGWLERGLDVARALPPK